MIDCEKCEYYDREDERCAAFVCDGIDCPPLPCEEEKKIESEYLT